MKNSLIVKIAVAVCLVLLLVLAVGGGTVYWAIDKIKHIADSALHVSRGTVVAPPEAPRATNLTMPTKEVGGQDLAEAPPFTGSIRSNYYVSDDKNFISVEYFAPEKSSQLIDFYKTFFEGHDWILSASDQVTSTFLKEGNSLTLAVIAENKSLSITQYSLNLTKYSK